MSRKQNPSKTEFTFIDLFAGIGGMRLGFEQAGCRCVWSCEIDRWARKVYAANFGREPDAADVREVNENDVPDHDILLAGFPCQPFSQGGWATLRHLNQTFGFDDRTRGTLFFEIGRILSAKKPVAFLLENVPGLMTLNGGREFSIIMASLSNLGYFVHHAVLNAARWVPQKRERLFIVGFRFPTLFCFPNDARQGPPVRTILEDNVPDKYGLREGTWKWLQQHADKMRRKGCGYKYEVVDLDGQTRTLSARYGKDGSEILIPRPGNTPRKLTPRECARLMGFPDTFKIPASDTQAYRLFGNSVVVPLVRDIARKMVRTISKHATQNERG